MILWEGGPIGLLLALPFSIGALPAYRVLMVGAYDRTAGLLVAMLQHHHVRLVAADRGEAIVRVNR